MVGYHIMICFVSDLEYSTIKIASNNLYVFSIFRSNFFPVLLFFYLVLNLKFITEICLFLK